MKSINIKLLSLGIAVFSNILSFSMEGDKGTKIFKGVANYSDKPIEVRFGHISNRLSVEKIEPKRRESYNLTLSQNEKGEFPTFSISDQSKGSAGTAGKGVQKITIDNKEFGILVVNSLTEIGLDAFQIPGSEF